MKVRDIAALLKNAKAIRINWDGLTYPLDTKNILMMDAFGDYIASGIMSIDREEYEIEIAATPLKAM